jgi:hypothetical protein
MKSISLSQPWAQLIAIGAKTIETRSWRTYHRGTLAIHAAQRIPPLARRLIMEEPFYSTLRKAYSGGAIDGWLPLGAIVAVCELSEIIHIPPQWEMSIEYPTEPELSFGDYTPGRYAWYLKNIHPLQVPIPCKGALSVWDVPGDVEAKVREQLCQ